MPKLRQNERFEQWVGKLRKQIEQKILDGNELDRMLRLLRVLVEDGVDAIALNLDRIGIRPLIVTASPRGDEDELRRFLERLTGRIRFGVQTALAGFDGRYEPIKTLPQLVAYPVHELYKRRGMGRKSGRALMWELARLGLHFGMSEEEIRRRFPAPAPSDPPA